MSYTTTTELWRSRYSLRHSWTRDLADGRLEKPRVTVKTGLRRKQSSVSQFGWSGMVTLTLGGASRPPGGQCGTLTRLLHLPGTSPFTSDSDHPLNYSYPCRTRYSFVETQPGHKIPSWWLLRLSMMTNDPFTAANERVGQRAELRQLMRQKSASVKNTKTLASKYRGIRSRLLDLTTWLICENTVSVGNNNGSCCG